MSSAVFPPLPDPLPPRTLGQPIRYTLFWPVLVFFLFFGAFTFYQIMNLENQLDQVTRAIDRMDVRVKKSQAAKARFYAITKEILRLAPGDPIADQIARQYNLRKLVPDDASTLDNVLAPAPNGMPAPTNSALVSPAQASAVPSTNSILPPDGTPPPTP